ncbi:MAG: hypothetical protein EXS41_08470 [Opitutaceae bacterium]|nr:hypothetical protein [Opitutaceae bacterium]
MSAHHSRGRLIAAWHLRALLTGILLPVATALAQLDAPVSPNALPEVGALMRFLKGVEGDYVLAGQQEIAWDENRAEEDMDYIFRTTGKYPAVRGFDFLDYVRGEPFRSRQRSTERALAWARRGGIVTYCVHLFMRTGSNDGSYQFYVPSANNGRGTTIDSRQVAIEGTPENAEFIRQIDIIADELKRLRDARVPVIWRPLHECSGGWFWWGANGAAAFKQVWRMMFERYTRVHGLNNLLWCYNPTDSTSRLAEWYPGDDVVDAISLDAYPNPGSHPTYAVDYKRMRDFKDGRKIVALSENGTIPDPDAFFSEDAGWNYFCTWNGFENDLSRNSVAHLVRVFTHPKVITLDELPALFQARAFNITAQPRPQLVVAGSPLALAVRARDDGPLAYQWSKDGVAIPGATSADYLLVSASTSAAGSYSVRVAGTHGTLPSDPAVVSIAATDRGRLHNLSVRATAGTGAQTLVTGFALAGDTVAKDLVIRAVGPSLVQFGIVSGFQIDPALRIDTFVGTSPPVAFNDNWASGDGAAAAAFSAVGAFPLLENSRDAALVGSFSPGVHTATVNLTTGVPGLVLAEIYDTAPGVGARLVNLSARGQVGGTATFIAGFVVGGDTRTVLIRAVGGKTLADFGVSGALANPRLELYRTGTEAPIATNDEWTQTTPAFSTLGVFFAEVGAFPLDNGSKDAVLLVSLPPAAYSVQVKSADTAAGVALVEIYEIR